MNFFIHESFSYDFIYEKVTYESFLYMNLYMVYNTYITFHAKDGENEKICQNGCNIEEHKILIFLK